MQLLRTPEGRNMLLAGGLTLIWAVLLVAIADQVVGVFSNTMMFTLTGLGVAVLGLLFFRSLTRRYRKRLSARFRAFPPDWEKWVVHVIPEPLEEAEIEALQKQVMMFLAEKAQTGVGKKPPEQLRVSLSTAMHWPIRHFPEWDYPELLEVVWYNFSFLREPEKYHILVDRLQSNLKEESLISVLPVSTVDIADLVSQPGESHPWMKWLGVEPTEVPPSISQSPLQLIALNYIKHVIEYGIKRRLLSESARLSMPELMQLADHSFYGDKKRLIHQDRKAAEAMSFVFQGGRLGWRRAMADLAWQLPGILGPKAPQIDELA